MIILVGDGDRPWLGVAADAIRSTARRNGLAPPPLADAFEVLATARPTETISPISADVGDDPGMPLLYRREQAAELLNVSPRTVDRLVAAGELRAVTVLHDRRIAREDLVAFVEQRRQAGPAAS